ncbi:MAG: hypothetical protein Q9191_000910 [Dirinaria sp. TL-2023a]
MASVISLGIHKPSAIAYLISEGVLPPEPSENLYKWQTVQSNPLRAGTTGGDDEGGYEEEELLSTQHCVIWSRGGVVQRAFRFDIEGEAVSQATFTHFFTSREHDSTSDASRFKSPFRGRIDGRNQHGVDAPADINEDPTVVYPPFTNGAIDQHKRFISRALVVRTVVAQKTPVARASSRRHLSALSLYDAVDPKEQIIYISSSDELKETGMGSPAAPPLLLAVTQNQESKDFSIWSVRYIIHESSRKPKPRDLLSLSSSVSRRRSSYVRGTSTGANTPVARNVSNGRDSLGAVRSRATQNRDVLSDDSFNETDKDLVSHLDSALEDTNATVRSRRVSSILARGDLSTTYEKTLFTDFAIGHPSFSNGQRSTSFGRSSVRLVHGFENDIALARAKVSHGLRSSIEPPEAVEPQNKPIFETSDGDELGAEMKGLSFDGGFEDLRVDLAMSKIQVLPYRSLNRLNDKKSTNSFTRPKVFVLRSPNHAGSLTTLTLDIANEPSAAPGTGSEGPPEASTRLYDDPRIRVVNISQQDNPVDACTIRDGDCSRMLVLDNSADGSPLLSLQAPWATSFSIQLPTRLNVYNPFQIANNVPSKQTREGGFRRVISQGPQTLIGLEHSGQRNEVDLVDTKGTRHRIEIQLLPRNYAVSKMIDLCDSILSYFGQCGGQILHGWWSALSWLRRRAEDEVDPEWTAFVLCLFSMAVASIADQRSETTTRQKKRKSGLLRSSSGANTNLESWEAMLIEECNPCSIWPAWMKSEAWNWAIIHERSSPRPQTNTSKKAVRGRSSNSILPGTLPTQKKSSYLANCVSLAREFKQSLDTSTQTGSGQIPIDSSADSVRMTLATLLIGLHLLREEFKLNTLSSDLLHRMTPILTQLGGWLKWPSWGFRGSASYTLENIEMDYWLFDDSAVQDLEKPAEPFPPPSILQFIQTVTSKSMPQPFVTLLNLVGHPDGSERWSSHKGSSNRLLMALTPRTTMTISLLTSSANESVLALVLEMSSWGLKLSSLETLPESLAVRYRAALSFCQARPSPSLGKDTLEMIGRDDVSVLDSKVSLDAFHGKSIMPLTSEGTRDIHTICNSTTEVETIGAYDGSAEVDRQSITRILFKDDQRFAEASKLLHPLHAPVAQCIPEPDWSDTELLEAQQELAKAIAMRTLAVSTGRSCLFYNARLPLLTEKFPIHGFTLSCVMQPSNTTVTADKVAYTEEKVSWAFFHAGVEAGLSIATSAKGVDTSWIIFNKPSELKNRHAGFLLALGLNGHLKAIAKWVAFKYLTPKHTMTSIGLLLGLAASYLGTMNTLVTRLLSVHVTRMLPPGAAELNLSLLTQTSGIMGIGLLYCNSQHRRMSEIMLSEMENLDQDDNSSPQDSLRDEGYRLAAGFALGYINLGRGKDLKGLHDMRIVERLLVLAVGTKKVNLVHILDKATAAATVAIALIFMKTQDAALARRVDVPDTVHQFDYVRPDLFLLRTVARHLIMWYNIRATHAWMKKQLPSIYQYKFKLIIIRSLNSEDLPFFNIIAGLCLSIGFRFAGTGSIDVRNLLCHYLDQFMRICRLPVLNYDNKLTRITVRNCQDVVALAIACVMAGTGDLQLFRRLRSLHGRTEVDVPYGSHLATHLALGMLFLGGGTHTFSTSNIAIASLLCALYPLFPTTVLDNKSHLQAFRHFWVLAAEPRCLVVYDIDTRRLLSLPVIVTLKEGSEIAKSAPCLLPELDTIAKIETNDPEYWIVTVDLAGNPAHQRSFKRHQSIYVRQRAIYNAQVSIFGATTQALNDVQSAHRLGRHIFEWIFTLPTFEGFDRAERALVLPPDLASTVYRVTRGTVIDDRLVLEKACLESGKIERLWNLRILFAWAEFESRSDMKWGWIGQEVIEALKARLIVRKRTHNVSQV